jgi:hypothetical protein
LIVVSKVLGINDTDAYFKEIPNCGSGVATGKARDLAARRTAAVRR